MKIIIIEASDLRSSVTEADIGYYNEEARLLVFRKIIIIEVKIFAGEIGLNSPEENYSSLTKKTYA